MDSTPVMFEQVAVFGPGLIGGSMGLAMRRRQLARRIRGIGRRAESLDRALAVGAIDEATLEPGRGVRDADLVILATPIRALPAIASAIAPHLKPGALVTDVASTKAEVVRTIASALGSRPDVAYVPSHPMAGSERSGPEAAAADLFEGAVCILTAGADTDPAAAAVDRLWKALGARVVHMTPEAHDRTVARVSHLPHLAAAALMVELDPGQAALCGRSLLDTTRVASGDPEIWIDICASNRKQVRQAVLDHVAVLRQMADSLAAGDLEPLRRLLVDARTRREGLLRTRPTAPPDNT